MRPSRSPSTKVALGETQKSRGGISFGPFLARVPHVWTSGRKCNFSGCGRVDLQPAIINGWFWASTGQRIEPKNSCQVCDWSGTGGSVCSRKYFFKFCYLYVSNVQSGSASTGQSRVSSELRRRGGGVRGHPEQLLRGEAVKTKCWTGWTRSSY